MSGTPIPGQHGRQEFRLHWRGIALTLHLTPGWLDLADHLEIRSEGRIPLPLTETGYRSHFTPIGQIAAYGGALRYVADWLDAEAARKGWTGAQLSLF